MWVGTPAAGAPLKRMTLELGGGSPQSLTDTRHDESPSFAPNGRLLLYATRLQGSDVLMTTTLDGRIKTRLVSSGADMREPRTGRQLDERGELGAVALAPGELGSLHAERAAGRVDDPDAVHRARFERRVRPVA